MTYDEHVTWPEDLISANKDPWISTSTGKDFAIFWANFRFLKIESYVYQISLAGIENKALDIDEAYKKDGKQHPRSNEGEIAIKDAIPWSNVQGWYIIRPGEPPGWKDRPSSLDPLKPNDPRKPVVTSKKPRYSKHWVETWREDTGSLTDWRSKAASNHGSSTQGSETQAFVWYLSAQAHAHFCMLGSDWRSTI